MKKFYLAICILLALTVTSCARQESTVQFNPVAHAGISDDGKPGSKGGSAINVFVIAPIASSLETDKSLKADSKIDAVWEGFKEAIKDAIPSLGNKDEEDIPDVDIPVDDVPATPDVPDEVLAPAPDPFGPATADPRKYENK